MNELKKELKGITLVALVVTIIVLLILAGIAISLTIGDNGLFTRTEKAGSVWNESSVRECIQMEVYASINENGEIDLNLLNTNFKKIEGLTLNGKTLEENPITNLPTDLELGGVKVKIETNGEVTVVGKDTAPVDPDEENKNPPTDEDNQDPYNIAGKKYNTETPITIDGTTVIVPGGSTISGVPGECKSIETGIVVYIIPEGEDVIDWKADTNGNGILDVQETYDQFVWVPVPNVLAVDMDNDGDIDVIDIKSMMAEGRFPMAIKIKDTENYRGILYDFSLEDSKVAISYRSWSSAERDVGEPAFCSGSDGKNYNKVGVTLNSMQSEFDEMITKVSKNKGFWIGRYETSNILGTATTKYSDSLNQRKVEADTTNKVKVVKGTTLGVCHDESVANWINWYRMYAQQKNYSKHANISPISSMIWGSQWDQVMLWMKEIENTNKDSYYILNSLGMGNHDTSDDSYTDTEKIAPTGFFAVKNIYDLGGNASEWTLEGYNINYRTLRRRMVRWR